MKLREAAEIMNLPLEDITVENLKFSYRKLLLAWDPEKCKDLSARQKYMLITEAYKKLNGVIEGKEPFQSDEQHELAAFMRMFMDMVGISGNESISNAAMTFGMMFGSRSSSVDEWSSDDNDFEDEEAEVYDEIVDEEFDCSQIAETIPSWEPQVKVYSNMNLKEEISNTRAINIKEAAEIEQDNLWIEKKQEKKRKGKKEKKQVETLRSKTSSQDLNFPSSEIVVDEYYLKQDFLDCIHYGNFEKSFELLSLVSTEDDPRSQTYHLFFKELEQSNLLHKCITDTKIECNSSVVAGRIKIADYLLSSKNIHIDLSCCDDTGLSVLHKSVVCGDNEFLKFMIRIITDAEAANLRINLNLNSRCRKKGWAPIHYAVEKHNKDAIIYLANAGANIQATSATDKKLTPMELVKQKLKSAVDGISKTQFNEILDTLTELSTLRKSEKNRNKIKTESDSDVNTSKTTIESTATKETKGNAKEKKRKRSEKKKIQESISTHNIQAEHNQDSVKEANSDANVYADLEISVSSRDEMVDHLLAMGFKESECLTAISLYGTDIDKILSWLCERPSSSHDNCDINIQAEIGEKSGKNCWENEQVQLNRKKEEMRRINRAWNARTEDEKRKAGSVKRITGDTINSTCSSSGNSSVLKESAEVAQSVAPAVAWSYSNLMYHITDHKVGQNDELINCAPADTSSMYYGENLSFVDTSNSDVVTTLNVPVELDRYPIADIFVGNSSNLNDNVRSTFDACDGQGTFESHNNLVLCNASSSEFLDLQLHDQVGSENKPFIDGTLELSAGAKPFIPKTFVVSNQSNPVLPVDLDTLPVLQQQQYSIEASQFFQQNVWNCDTAAINFSLGCIVPQDFPPQSPFARDEMFYDSLLQASLLDNEFEYDSASNLMPVLDSLFDGSELK